MLASLLATAPAFASGGIICEGGDGVSAHFASGRLPVLRIIGAHVEIGDPRWSLRGVLLADNKTYDVACRQA